MNAISRRRLLAWLGAFAGADVLAQPAPANSSAVEARQSLVFGLLTTREPEKIVAAWTPLLQRIGAEVGRPITAWAAPTPAQLVDAFKSGRVDLAWIGNAPALELVEANVGEVFAQMVTGDGRTGYQSILITHKDSGLNNLDDVQRPGMRLVFGDGELKSTSGHLVPLYYAFVKRGINEPKSLYAQVRHSGHRVNLHAAVQREVDFATTNNVELDMFRSEHPQLAAQLRVIWQSPMIPQSPLVWATRLPIELRRRLQQAVVSFGSRGPAEAQILRTINDLSGFRKSRNLQLITVADLEMFSAWQKVNNDTSLSPSDKLAQVTAISQRASRLELRLKLPPTVP